MALTIQQLPTATDLLDLDPDYRWEIFRGMIEQRAMPTGQHGLAQSSTSGEVRGSFRRRGPDGRAGWWILTEPTIEFDPENVLQPDIAGWRRDRHPASPRGYPVTALPDWICEVVSPTSRARDLKDKPRLYHRCGIPHYWILDPDLCFLTVYRWTDAGYLLVLTATAEERVRAEPFDAVELWVGALLGEDEPEEATP